MITSPLLSNVAYVTEQW